MYFKTFVVILIVCFAQDLANGSKLRKRAAANNSNRDSIDLGAAIQKFSKSGSDSESKFEIWQLIAIFSEWSSEYANEINKCTEAKIEAGKLSDVLQTCQKNFELISGSQEAGPSCQNLAGDISKSLDKLAQLSKEFVENNEKFDTPKMESWVKNSIEEAGNIWKNMEAAVKENCATIVNSKDDCQANLEQAIINVYNKIETCRKAQTSSGKSVKRRSVNCAQAIEYLENIQNYATQMITQIEENIKNTDCKKAFERSVKDVKAKIEIVFISNYDQTSIEILKRTIEDNYKALSSQCDAKKDFEEIIKLYPYAAQLWEKFGPNYKEKLYELRDACFNQG